MKSDTDQYRKMLIHDVPVGMMFSIGSPNTGLLYKWIVENGRRVLLYQTNFSLGWHRSAIQQFDEDTQIFALVLVQE